MAALSVRLPDEMSRRLEKLVKETRRTRSSLIVEMLEENIDDYEAAAEALKRLTDKNATYLTTEEVEKELGL